MRQCSLVPVVGLAILGFGTGAALAGAGDGNSAPRPATAGAIVIAQTTTPPAAQPQAQPKRPRSPSPAGAEVYFVDLQDGAHVPPTFNVRIGLRKMGVAPAGVAFPSAGHNHIIIDSDLPSLDEEIPADLNHIHFGAGETEGMISLPPGEHTLQLMLADQDHVSFDPPVYSPKIHITVMGNQASPAVARSKAPADATVYFISPHDGEVIGPTTVVRFGLHGMGVAPTSVTRAGTGHHHLLIDADPPAPDDVIPNDFNHLHFGGGETEGPVTLPPGKHTLQIVFADSNHMPFDPPVMSKRITVTVRPEKRGKR